MSLRGYGPSLFFPPMTSKVPAHTAAANDSRAGQGGKKKFQLMPSDDHQAAGVSGSPPRIHSLPPNEITCAYPRGKPRSPGSWAVVSTHAGIGALDQGVMAPLAGGAHLSEIVGPDPSLSGQNATRPVSLPV